MLIVALIFLLVMTMLILASVRGTVMQERMASNLYDRSLAFQAAEAALREGERFVLENAPKPSATGCDSDGNCSKPDPADAPAWQEEDNWDNAHSAEDGHGHVISIGDLPVPPQFLVELLADDMPEVNVCESTAVDPDAPCYAGPEGLRYRITARSGEAGRAVVLLQSVYAVPKPAGW
ncbi:MAG TPA: PilX N-terminal domain-containing pilus assembly protein [Steroidobacteraceae bacterium]|nr:PilX N-terminal domain-containing pilus assembly protein [Steroidobacteraceae bacterium]